MRKKKSLKSERNYMKLDEEKKIESLKKTPSLDNTVPSPSKTTPSLRN